MQISFDEYIVNPMGVKNSVWTHRDVYANLYKGKLDKIQLREAGKIDYKVYHSVSDNTYVIHIKIPSEVVDRFYYDTIIKFENGNSNSRNLRDYKVKFYSNDPRFVFTFAYTFKKNDMFITELSSKMSKKALKDKPKITNSTLEIGYVKSIYFAYILMNQYRLFEKIYFEMNAIKMSTKQIFSEIIKNTEDADKKIDDRERLGAEVEKKKKNKSLSNSKKQSPVRTSHTPDLETRGVSVTKTAVKSGLIKTKSAVSITSKIKRTKRI